MDAPVTEWPADKVERWPIERPKAYGKNARTHSDEQVEQIAESIRAFGFTMPLLADEKDELIAGHGRLAGAKLAGLAEVPIMVARGWTDKQIKAYRIADNQLALNAGWDYKLLAAELEGLPDMADLMGFSEADLRRIGAFGGTAGNTDPDEAPPLPEEPVTKPGDLYTLGTHRLLCGDSTNTDDVARLLGEVVPNLMVTDPPYGVAYNADWRNHALRTDGTPYTGRAIGKVKNDERADWREAWALFPGNIAYVWHGGLHAGEVLESLAACGFAPRAQIIWAKSAMVISRGDYHWQHEPCWYAVKKKGNWKGDRSQTTLWTIDHRKSETGHSTQKPVECMRRPMVNSASAGQAVYDPFCGSGTTIIAAEMESRAAMCMEIDPAYCDVAVKRWEDFTGLKATVVPGDVSPPLQS